MRPVRYELFGSDTWRDPFPLYRRLRDEDPVHFSESLGIWVLSRFADVYAASLDSSRFSSASGISLRNEREKLRLYPTMVMMDPPEHTANRRMVNRSFSPRNVLQIEPAVRQFVASCVDRLREAETTATWWQGSPDQCPASSSRTISGSPRRTGICSKRGHSAIVQANVGGHSYGAGDALSDLYGYFSELVATATRRPGRRHDLRARQRGPDGSTLSTEEILGYAFVMIAGGNDTATGLISRSRRAAHRAPRAAQGPSRTNPAIPRRGRRAPSADHTRTGPVPCHTDRGRHRRRRRYLPTAGCCSATALRTGTRESSDRTPECLDVAQDCPAAPCVRQRGPPLPRTARGQDAGPCRDRGAPAGLPGLRCGRRSRCVR